jgi:ABC-type phosphate transport system substrate-binding protein
MKTSNFSFWAILVSLFAVGSLKASDDPSDRNQQLIYISSARFSSTLVEKWIAEYVKQNPNAQIKQVEKNSQEIDLNFVTSAEQEITAGHDVAYVGRYALLPVTTKGHPLYKQITKKKFGKKELRKLFFVEDLSFDEDEKKDPLQSGLTVYSGNSSTSGAALFASFFGFPPSNFRGKRISGDDIYLLNAIRKDSTGITVNNLSYIFDLNDRQLKDDVALLPLDLKKEQLETLRSENLDETIALLEEQKVDLIPVQNIGFAYNEKEGAKEGAKDFLRWILTEGQQYNHQFGFLKTSQQHTPPPPKGGALAEKR